MMEIITIERDVEAGFEVFKRVEGVTTELGMFTPETCYTRRGYDYKFRPWAPIYDTETLEAILLELKKINRAERICKGGL